MENIKIGDRVKVTSKNVGGVVAFIGETHIQKGIWFGIILDEAKGTHDGTIGEERYFNCARNCGIFVRVSQIVKESIADERKGNATLNKIMSPNYLRTSLKLKADKHGCFSKKVNIHKTDSELNNEVHNVKNTSDIQNNSKRVPEWQRNKTENEILKRKLKFTEAALQESLHNFTNAMEEIKQLKVKLDCKETQLSIHKCHLNLLKLRQCNHYKVNDSLKSLIKNSNNIFIDNGLVEQDSSVDVSASSSDEEYDLERMKDFIFEQRSNEFEEKNRILVQGLVELREFINSNCQSKVNFHVPDTEIHRPESGKKISDINSLPNYNDSSIFIRNLNFSAENSESQLKECSYMLQEMRRFSELMTDSGRMGKNVEATDIEVGTYFKLAQKEQISEDNKRISRFRNQLPNLVSKPNNKISLSIANTQEVQEACHNLSCLGSNDFQNHVLTTDNQSLNQSLKLTLQLKTNKPLSCSSVKEISKVSDSEQLRTKRVVVYDLEEKTCRSNMSFMQENTASLKMSEFKSSLPTVSEEVPEFHLDPPNHSAVAPELQLDLSTHSAEAPELQLALPTHSVEIPKFHLDSPTISVEVPECQLTLPTHSVEVPEFHLDSPTHSEEEHEIQLVLPSHSMDFPKFQLHSPTLSVEMPKFQFALPTNSAERFEFHLVSPTLLVDVPEFQSTLPTHTAEELEIQLDSPILSVEAPEFHLDSPTYSEKEPEIQLALRTHSEEVPEFHLDSPTLSLEVLEFQLTLPTHSTVAREFLLDLPTHSAKDPEIQLHSPIRSVEVPELQSALPTNSVEVPGKTNGDCTMILPNEKQI